MNDLAGNSWHLRSAPAVAMAPYRKSRDEGCCSVQFLKYVIFIFNFVFLITGCGVLAVGIWTIISKHQYVSLLVTSTYAATAYILVVAGVIVLLVTVIACLGVCKEDRCCLLIFTFMLLLIFLLEAVAGVIAYVYEEQVWSELQSSLNETFLSSYNVDNDKTLAIDNLQRQYHCCGATDFEDWHKSTWQKASVRQLVPDSCCKTESLRCGFSNHPSNIYEDGCIRKLEAHIADHLIILGAVGLGICLVQIFGMIFSCCLYIRLRDYREIYY